MSYYGGGRAEEFRMLRAADAATALIVAGAGLQSYLERFVIVRLLGTMVDSSGFGSSDPASTLHSAASALQDRERLLARAAADRDEPMVRELLYRALRSAIEIDWGPGEEIGFTAPALTLGPFARRLRLLLRNLGRPSAAVARQIGKPPHQLHHWAAGQSKPNRDDRVSLANALGIHSGWLDADRDTSVDIWLYRFGRCPCGTDADFRPGDLDDIEGFVESGVGMWCCGCGQPYLHATDGWLYPVPVTDGSSPSPLPFTAVRDSGRNVGGELGRPWPHALWVRHPRPDCADGECHTPAVLTCHPGVWQ